MIAQMSLFEESEDKSEAMPSTIPQRVSRGDLWALGNHRLLCGDATNAGDIARLMQGEQFSLCFTSPPYSNQRSYKLGAFDWNALMCSAFDRMTAHGTPDCHILINLGLTHKDRQVDMYWMQWLMHCAAQGWPLFGWYSWDQGTGLPGEWGGRLAPCHEFIFHFNQNLNYANKWVKTKERPLSGTALRSKADKICQISSPDKIGQPFKIPDSVIRINRENARGVHTANHPAVFPVALPEFMMRTWSQPGDIVYEPFAGSGTSLLAGSNLKRRVFACEISPEYCDLCIARWEMYTGQKAILA